MIAWPVKPYNTKYTKWYENLIEKRKNNPPIGYTETHHVIPRSMNGDNSPNNLVKLTAREHYIAHALLWKMNFPKPYHIKMTYAFGTFMHGFKGKKHKTYKFSSRVYESFKKDFALQLSLEMTGKKMDPSIVEKSAAKRRGKKAHELFSPMALTNIAAGRQHRVYKEETAKVRDEIIREIGKRPKSEEHKRKIAESGKGKHNHFGKNNPMFGKKHSPETIEKIRQTKLKKNLQVDIK